MLHQSFKSTYSYCGEERDIIYNLYFKNAFYSFECFIEGDENDYGYIYVNDITDDEGEAENFGKKMSEGKVLPVHIEELLEDYFTK